MHLVDFVHALDCGGCQQARQPWGHTRPGHDSDASVACHRAKLEERVHLVSSVCDRDHRDSLVDRLPSERRGTGGSQHDHPSSRERAAEAAWRELHKLDRARRTDRCQRSSCRCPPADQDHQFIDQY
jgi:hypothetical protein